MKTIHELHSPNVSVFCCSVILLRSLTIVQSLPSMTHLSDGPGKCTHTKHKHNLSGLPYRNGFCITIVVSLSLTLADKKPIVCVDNPLRGETCSVTYPEPLYFTGVTDDETAVSYVFYTLTNTKTVCTFCIKERNTIPFKSLILQDINVFYF